MSDCERCRLCGIRVCSCCTVSSEAMQTHALECGEPASLVRSVGLNAKAPAPDPIPVPLDLFPAPRMPSGMPFSPMPNGWRA